jgi:MFS family permease
LRFLRGEPDILVLSLVKGAGALTVGGGLAVLQVRYAQQLFPIGEGGSISLGLMYAVVGVGTGLGPIAARRVVGDRQVAMRWTLVSAFVMQAIGMVIVWLAPTLTVALAGMTIRSVGGGIIWVFSAALLLLLLPDGVRGRVFAFEFALFMVSYALSSAVGGWLLDASNWDVRILALAMGATTLAAGVLFAAWWTRPPSSRQPEPIEILPSA